MKAPSVIQSGPECFAKIQRNFRILILIFEVKKRFYFNAEGNRFHHCLDFFWIKFPVCVSQECLPVKLPHKQTKKLAHVDRRSHRNKNSLLTCGHFKADIRQCGLCSWWPLKTAAITAVTVTETGLGRFQHTGNLVKILTLQH